MTPNDQMSERLSAALPLACSGAMCAAVPIMAPACVAPMVNVGEFCGLPSLEGGGSMAFANPKSRILTTPSGVILMLAGFRSRLMMFFSCAAYDAVNQLVDDGERVIEVQRTAQVRAFDILHD